MQMQSFATLVEANEQFKLAKGRRRLDDREQALLNAVYQVGEHELAKLRVRYEKKTAEARQERERQRFMGTLFSLVGAEGRKAALTFLTRPYIEYYRPVKQITGTATPAAGLVDEVVVEPNPSGAILAQQGSDEPQERRYRSMVEAFSGWPKAFLLFVESSFARMSPLTTAIWFGLVVAGAVALGWAQRTYLIATYDFYKEQAKLVKPAEEKRREVERELEKGKD